jgi:uncharacterized RDD family membrane protein YckC
MTEAPFPPSGEDTSPDSSPPSDTPIPPAAPPPAPYTPSAPPPPVGFPPPPPPPPPGGGYGAPAPQPYGSPPAFGSGYGQQPAYGSPPQGYPGAGPAGDYASWGLRIQSALLDYIAPFLVAGVIYAISRPLGALVYLVALGYALYQAYLGGQTGQSYGKKTAGTRLISEQTGQPIGGGLGIGRYLLHIVDAIPCYLGYLWPLWDAKKQTFADKIVTSVVVKS